MAERVRTDALGDRRGERRLADRPLDGGLVEVVAAALARDAVRIDARGREDPLPGPFSRGAGILDAQGVRQFDAARIGREISLMLFVDCDQMMSQELSQRRGKQRDAILAPLSVPDDQLLPAEVDVLDPQAQSFKKAQAGPVQQASAQILDAGHLVQHRRDLAAGQDDGDAVGTLGVNNVRQPIDLPAQDLLVQEQQPGQCLILCRRGDAAIHRQHGQEGADHEPTRRRSSASFVWAPSTSL